MDTGVLQLQVQLICEKLTLALHNLSGY